MYFFDAQEFLLFPFVGLFFLIALSWTVWKVKQIEETRWKWVERKEQLPEGKERVYWEWVKKHERGTIGEIILGILIPSRRGGRRRKKGEFKRDLNKGVEGGNK